MAGAPHSVEARIQAIRQMPWGKWDRVAGRAADEIDEALGAVHSLAP